MNNDTYSHDIVAAAESVIAETRAIDAAIQELDEHVRLRKAAVRRLAKLSDLRIEITAAPTQAANLEDVVLLEIYRTGEHGASLPHLRAALRHRFGQHFEMALLDAALQALVDAEKIVDRDGTVFAPIARLDDGASAGNPGTIKGRIIQLLEQHSGGMKTAEISQAFSEGGVDIRVHTISPILSRLAKKGRVRHEGKFWRLVRA